MPHTHRSFHDRGIADTIWKRARWARQAKDLVKQAKDNEFWGRPEKRGSIKKEKVSIPNYVTAAIATFLKGNQEDAKRERRPNGNIYGSQRRFNRQR